jgi:hypothetical protein
MVNGYAQTSDKIALSKLLGGRVLAPLRAAPSFSPSPPSRAPGAQNFLTWSATEASCGGRVLDVLWTGSHRGPERKVGGWGVCSHCLPGSRQESLSCWSGFSRNWVDRAFNGFLIPLLGLVVFPYATLFYVLAYNPVTGGLAGWGWIFVVLGFVFDIGHWVGGGVTGRQRYASA